jgi:hypothetical protein
MERPLVSSLYRAATHRASVPKAKGRSRSNARASARVPDVFNTAGGPPVVFGMTIASGLRGLQKWASDQRETAMTSDFRIARSLRTCTALR